MSRRTNVYRLIDDKGNTICEGSYDKCSKLEKDRIVFIGSEVPVFRATDDNGLDITGNIYVIADKLKMKRITLYNYTRYKRHGDGLKLEKIGTEVVKN